MPCHDPEDSIDDRQTRLASRGQPSQLPARGAAALRAVPSAPPRLEARPLRVLLGPFRSRVQWWPHHGGLLHRGPPLDLRALLRGLQDALRLAAGKLATGCAISMVASGP